MTKRPLRRPGHRGLPVHDGGETPTNGPDRRDGEGARQRLHEEGPRRLRAALVAPEATGAALLTGTGSEPSDTRALVAGAAKGPVSIPRRAICHSGDIP